MVYVSMAHDFDIDSKYRLYYLTAILLMCYLVFQNNTLTCSFQRKSMAEFGYVCCVCRHMFLESEQEECVPGTGLHEKHSAKLKVILRSDK